MHVIVNAMMLLAFGTPVARAFGNTPTGWGLWMIVFLGSIIAGSALYLGLATVQSYYAVGASGGTSGLIAAAAYNHITTSRMRDAARNLDRSALIGLGLTAAMIVLTENNTATEYSPVRYVAADSQTGNANTISSGLAQSMKSTSLSSG